MRKKGKAGGELRKETGIGKANNIGNPSALWKVDQNLLSASAFSSMQALLDCISSCRATEICHQ